MSYCERHAVSVTTTATGIATGYTPVVVGRIVAVQYSKATGGLASTTDVTVTTEDTGQAVWSATNLNASTTVSPLVAAVLTSGAASSLSELPVYAAGERVKIAIAQGGNAKTGSFAVIVG